MWINESLKTRNLFNIWLDCVAYKISLEDIDILVRNASWQINWQGIRLTLWHPTAQQETIGFNEENNIRDDYDNNSPCATNRCLGHAYTFASYIMLWNSITYPCPKYPLLAFKHPFNPGGAENRGFKRSRPINRLMMPLRLASPGHQQPWYWLHAMGLFLSFVAVTINNLRRFDVQDGVKYKYILCLLKWILPDMGWCIGRLWSTNKTCHISGEFPVGSGGREAVRDQITASLPDTSRHALWDATSLNRLTPETPMNRTCMHSIILM